MIDIRYRAHDGSMYSDGDAAVIGPALADLAARDIPLTPHVVVDEATPESSPLHPFFEWDDAEAAHRYRVHQARQMLGAIEVEVIVDDAPSTWVRGFHNVTVTVDDRRKRGYVTLAVATSDTDIWSQVVGRAIAELESWRDRYGHYAGFAATFAPVIAAIDEAGRCVDR